MAYWCDDRRLDIEQRRLDADQQRALEKLRAKQRDKAKDHPNAG